MALVSPVLVRWKTTLLSMFVSLNPKIRLWDTLTCISLSSASLHTRHPHPTLVDLTELVWLLPKLLQRLSEAGLHQASIIEHLFL